MSNAALLGRSKQRINLTLLGFLALFGAAGLGTGAFVATGEQPQARSASNTDRLTQTASLPPELAEQAKLVTKAEPARETTGVEPPLVEPQVMERGAEENGTEDASSVPLSSKVNLASLPSQEEMAASEETASELTQESDPAKKPAEKLEEKPAEPSTITRLVEVKPGDTLMDMLTAEGITRRQAYNAIEALSKSFSPRKLRPGHALQLTLTSHAANETSKETSLESENAEPQPEVSLTTLALTESPMREVIVALQEDGLYESSIIEKPTERISQRAEGIIETSLYDAAVAQGVPAPVLGDLIHIFSFDVDFQREVRAGDTFALMYDVIQVEGQTVDTGVVYMAEMTVGGKQRRYYRFKGKDGFWEYFDETGKSAKKALLRTPVDGARLSSGFGKRRHPILGYTKMHRGADFAAPTGTPIFAAGNGVVEVSGWNGGYGKYIRLRHNDTYKTAYAHLSRIAVSKGKRVKQGQVIGYVGSTGRSTGPHLHYEVHQNGRQVNPMGVKLPTGRSLKGDELAAFKQHIAKLEGQFASLDVLELKEEPVTNAKVEDPTGAGQVATVE